jgi:hypothetical protein
LTCSQRSRNPSFSRRWCLPRWSSGVPDLVCQLHDTRRCHVLDVLLRVMMCRLAEVCGWCVSGCFRVAVRVYGWFRGPPTFSSRASPTTHLISLLSRHKWSCALSSESLPASYSPMVLTLLILRGSGTIQPASRCAPPPAYGCLRGSPFHSSSHLFAFAIVG